MSAAQMISNEDQGIQLVTRWFDEVWNQGKRGIHPGHVPGG